MNYSTIVQSLTRGFRLSTIITLLALLAALLAPPQPARAGIPIMVTSINNSGDGTLREAITDANTNSGPDTIKFDDDLPDGMAIRLSGTAGDDVNVSGDLDILGTGGDLTIQGNGAGITIIDGDENDRVFHVCPGGGCTNTVTFSGVTIQNGVIFGGGGIRNEGGTTIVDSSIIRDNTAVNGGGIANFATLTIQNGSIIGGEGAGNRALGGNGGGIYNYAGTLTVDHSTVSANTAGKNGGGIWSQVTLNVQSNSTIGGPDAGNEADYGGGIFNKAGTTTVDGSIVSDNKANWGGGINNLDTLMIQNGSTIGGADAGNSANWGGGIYSATGTTTVEGSTVSVNTANFGGGIYNTAVLNVQNGSTIGGADAGNHANDAGGGILNISGGTTTVDASAVSDNTSDDDGGGIFNSAILIIQNGSTIGGAGAGNEAVWGGGIYNDAGTTTVDGSTVSANTTNGVGGGIYNKDTLIIQNGSTIGGVGVGNTAHNGGGIYNEIGSLTTVIGSTVSANSAVSGGGIYNDNEATLNVQNGSIIGGIGAGNMATAGGGIYSLLGNTMVDGSTVSANMAENGGGINNSGILTIQNGSTIGGVGAGNIANNYGGGIYNSVSTTTVTGSRFLNNTAANGGGVYNNRDADGATSVTSSCIVGNSVNSFWNSQPALQIATGNWWGAANGPNTLGADTVLGSVDVDPWLTSPILGCAPELQVSKANDTGGNGNVGTPFHWTLTVRNSGLVDATFDALQKILIDDLPAIGAAYGPPVTGSFANVTDGANINCSIVGSTLTCDAARGDVILGAVTGSFEVTFSVTSDVPMILINPSGVCRVDPDGEVTESDETNNDCPANVVNIELSSTYLPVVLK